MNHAKAAALSALLLLMATAWSPQARAEVSFDFFYSNLSPHGSWLVSAQYGRVWQPSVYRPGWSPYSDGHWIYSDLGWAWVSDYGWGAVPYHYGTWAFDPVFGWIWVPGYVWAPAWVVFRTGPDYIGWAPVPPGFSVGVSFGFREPEAERYVFVSSADFLSPRIRTRVVPGIRAKSVFNRTKVVNRITVENDVVINRGPDPSIVERASGRKIRRVPIEQVRGVAPGPRVTRGALRVDPQRVGRRPRAAEPVPGRDLVPAPGRFRPGAERRRGTNHGVSRNEAAQRQSATAAGTKAKEQRARKEGPAHKKAKEKQESGRDRS